MSRRTGYLKALGPGVLWAATAIGVSHLVQSTRAGATYGFGLVGLIVAANLLKYPLFEAGPRYAVATGESLLEGYVGLGRWAVVLYLLLTVGTMFTVLAAVTLVTGSLAGPLFGVDLSLPAWSVVLLAVSATILVVGRFPLLDALIKVVIVVLTASTLAALVFALTQSRPAALVAVEGPLWSGTTLAFVVALLGWMPTGIDMAAWHSLWTLRRARQTGHTPTWREARLDFNIGYVGTCVIALVFLVLGAIVMRPSGVPFAAGAGGFATQLVDLYTTTLGGWSRPIILLAAFTTMFSTTLAVSDGFPRVLARLGRLLTGERLSESSVYWASLAVLMVGAMLVILYLRAQFTRLIDLATTLSFLAAPVLGYLNYRVVTSGRVADVLQPPRWWRLLAWAGLVFLSGLGLVYLGWRFLVGP